MKWLTLYVSNMNVFVVHAFLGRRQVELIFLSRTTCNEFYFLKVDDSCCKTVYIANYVF